MVLMPAGSGDLLGKFFLDLGKATTNLYTEVIQIFFRQHMVSTHNHQVIHHR